MQHDTKINLGLFKLKNNNWSMSNVIFDTHATCSCSPHHFRILKQFHSFVLNPFTSYPILSEVRRRLEIFLAWLPRNFKTELCRLFVLYSFPRHTNLNVRFRWNLHLATTLCKNIINFCGLKNSFSFYIYIL